MDYEDHVVGCGLEALAWSPPDFVAPVKPPSEEYVQYYEVPALAESTDAQREETRRLIEIMAEVGPIDGLICRMKRDANGGLARGVGPAIEMGEFYGGMDFCAVSSVNSAKFIHSMRYDMKIGVFKFESESG